MKTNNKINWPNAAYLVVSPFVAALGLWYWLATEGFNLPTIILTVILASIIQVSITGGYHRLFAHRSYNAHWLVKVFFLIFGAAALEGSALLWSLDHRIHHNYVDDNDKDPYSIGKGFLWAHIGWLLFKHPDQLNQEARQRSGDLFADKLVMFQHKYWHFIGIFAGFVLPALIALAWGDFLGGLLIAGIVRSVLNHHATFLVNSLAHTLGDQTYSDKHSARDNILTAILTFGEGYHNYHHEFPSDYRNGVRFWDWDPTKWVIRALAFVGLTYDLKRIREEIIVRKRTQMKEKRLHKKLVKSDFFGTTQAAIMDGLKERYEKAFKELTSLRDRLQGLLKSKPKFSHDNNFLKLEVDVLKDQISQARDEFMSAVKDWNLMRRKVVLAYARV